MKIYEDKRSHPMKWVLAFLIFVMVMTVTFDSAFGVWLPKSGDSGSGSVQPKPDVPTAYADSKCPPPPQVPEPGTLLLLGAGVAAMHLMRKKKAD